MKRAMLPAGLAVLALSACSERLENDAGCPILCPQSIADIQTVEIEAAVLDTTVVTLQAPGSSRQMLLASRGDTLDTRVILRFDSLPQRYQPSTTDTTTSPITVITDASLRLMIRTVGGVIPNETTIDVFDVDTDAPDTAFAALLPLFTPDRLIGSRTFERDSIAGRDSVRIQLSGPAIVNAIEANRRLRIGLRISGTGSAQLNVSASESGLPAVFQFRPGTDTAVARQSFNPRSESPEAPIELRAHLADYVVFAAVPPRGALTELNVGGLPPWRTYFRFDIPRFILDSTTVVRATLLLTQRPNPAFSAQDTMGIVADLVLAGSAITDVTRAATLTAEALVALSDTLFTVPAEAGTRSIEIAANVRFWGGLDDDTPHALVLRSTAENTSALEARFFSLEAAPAMRPRLRISYSLRQPLGLP